VTTATDRTCLDSDDFWVVFEGLLLLASMCGEDLLLLSTSHPFKIFLSCSHFTVPSYVILLYFVSPHHGNKQQDQIKISNKQRLLRYMKVCCIRVLSYRRMSPSRDFKAGQFPGCSAPPSADAKDVTALPLSQLRPGGAPSTSPDELLNTIPRNSPLKCDLRKIRILTDSSVQWLCCISVYIFALVDNNCCTVYDALRAVY
jgi:hypothetical protein